MDEFTGQPGIGFSPSRVVIAETGDVLVFKMLGGAHQIRREFPKKAARNGR